MYPSVIGNWPVFSLIYAGESAILLYTAHMTLIDGYDAQTAFTSSFQIPESLLDESKRSSTKV